MEMQFAAVPSEMRFIWKRQMKCTWEMRDLSRIAGEVEKETGAKHFLWSCAAVQIH